MHNAINPLFEKDVYKFSRLIKALKRINKNQSSRKTTKILNEVEKYLNQWLANLNTNDSESLQEEPVEWLQKFSNWLQRGFEIHTEINDTDLGQKKELLALGYFLQGELSTEEELKYIKSILCFYLANIKQFRGSPSPR